MSNQNIEGLIKSYLSIRLERDQLTHEFEQKDAALKESLSKIEQQILAVCNEFGADSIKTSVGTAMRRVTERYTCTDWDEFYKFVLEHKVPQLLEKRIHQGNFRLFQSEVEGSGMPPGVNVMREYGITVRKPS